MFPFLSFVMLLCWVPFMFLYCIYPSLPLASHARLPDTQFNFRFPFLFFVNLLIFPLSILPYQMLQFCATFAHILVLRLQFLSPEFPLYHYFPIPFLGDTPNISRKPHFLLDALMLGFLMFDYRLFPSSPLGSHSFLLNADSNFKFPFLSLAILLIFPESLISYLMLLCWVSLMFDYRLFPSSYH